MIGTTLPPSCIPVILGCQGHILSDEERAFFTQSQPFGFILFRRNIADRAQLTQLVQALKSCVQHKDVPILIDQEGGRVARLYAPEWPSFPAAATFLQQCQGDITKACEQVYASHKQMAVLLKEVGVNVDCAPVADLCIPGAHDIIGDRAFGATVEQVVELANAAAKGLIDENITPIMKHIPGHGRALVDSHESLPIVEESLDVLKAQDFAIFTQLSQRGTIPWAMTAHIVYTALDKHRPATLSPTVINMIRKDIGFSGLILSDDISMKALTGNYADRTKAILAAGCDVVLHCNGNMEEMQQIIASLAV